MDVSELLNFKPSAAPKRPAASTEDPEAGHDEEFEGTCSDKNMGGGQN